jgi:hypothetical protein
MTQPGMAPAGMAPAGMAPVETPVPAGVAPVETPVPAAPAAGDDMLSTLAQLKQLGEVRSAGVLTQAEFEAQKARILPGAAGLRFPMSTCPKNAHSVSGLGHARSPDRGHAKYHSQSRRTMTATAHEVSPRTSPDAEVTSALKLDFL